MIIRSIIWFIISPISADNLPGSLPGFTVQSLDPSPCWTGEEKNARTAKFGNRQPEQLRGRAHGECVR